MKLFIVESPSKCGKIKSFLGDDYRIVASVGHILEIPKKGFNIDVKNNFTPTYQISNDKKQVVKEIKELASKAEKIFIGTDFDREGEGIGANILQILPEKDQKKCVRVTFAEITKKAVLDGIQNARKIDDNLVDAQKARQVVDRIVGYKVSPLLWFSINAKSAGRVQSIALKILKELESKIKAFIPTDFWYVESLLQNPNGEFWGKVVTKEKENRFIDEKLAIDAFETLKKSIYTLDKIDRETKERKPQPPFDTTSLQSTCSSLFGWNATKTMQIAQHLYESGRVTYIRSDSYNIAQEALDSVRNYIKEKFDNKYLSSKPNLYSKGKNTSSQESHESVHPTHMEDEGQGLDPDNRKMYELIRDRFLACQMTPMLVDTVVYNIKTDSKYTLIAKGQTIKFDGWFKVYKYSKTEEEVLPNANEGEKLNLKDIKKTKHTTQPPKRYNDGSLIIKMEADGIGRPSTRATILKTLVDRGYAVKEKGKSGSFIVTDLGMKVCEYLEPRFKDSFMDIKYTSQMEDELDLIAEGKKTYLEIVEKMYNNIATLINNAKEQKMEKKEQKLVGQKCTVCNEGDIVEVKGIYGIFYSCNKYPNCKSVFQKNDDGTYSLKEKKISKKVGRKCPECGSDLVERVAKKSGNTFVGCSAFPKCKFIEKDN